MVGHTYNSSSTTSPIDGYLFRYNTSGTLLNSYKVSHTSNKCSLWDLSFDTLGNIYLVANYSFPSISTSTATLGVSGNQAKAAIVKLNSSYDIVLSNDFFHQEAAGSVHAFAIDIGNKNTIYVGMDAYFFSSATNQTQSLALVKLNVGQHNNRAFKMDRHFLGYTNSLNSSTAFSISSSGISETSGSLTFQAHPASGLIGGSNPDHMVTSSYTNYKLYF
jgi:hypothetical protein